MNIRATTGVLLTLIICGGLGTALAQQSRASECVRAPFIQPLAASLFVARDDPRTPQFCGALGRDAVCPPILRYGGQGHGGIPAIEGSFKANLPNVRVSFVVQQISHEAVTGGGVLGDDVAGDIVTWTTHSPAASVELGGPYGWGLPRAGETWSDTSLTVYDALVFGACGTFSSFPVAHTAIASDALVEVGRFEGADNTTLTHTGFYNMSYTITAQDTAGRVSKFVFSGKVNVTCSAANSL